MLSSHPLKWTQVKAKCFKAELIELLESYDLELYEDDGQWNYIDSNYDRIGFIARPAGSPANHQPLPGEYINLATGGIG